MEKDDARGQATSKSGSFQLIGFILCSVVGFFRHLSCDSIVDNTKNNDGLNEITYVPGV